MQIVRIKLGRMVATLFLAGAMRPAGPALAESKAELDALNKEVHQLYQAGKYEEAIPVARRQVEVAEKVSLAIIQILRFPSTIWRRFLD